MAKKKTAPKAGKSGSEKIETGVETDIRATFMAKASNVKKRRPLPIGSPLDPGRTNEALGKYFDFYEKKNGQITHMPEKT